jgi:hypothetical protein
MMTIKTTAQALLILTLFSFTTNLVASNKITADFNNDDIIDFADYDSEGVYIYFYDYNYDGYILQTTYKIFNNHDDIRINEVITNSKGVLKIKTQWNNNGEKRNNTYTVRYQDNDFYLIGYDCTYNGTTKAYNLLTHKATIIEEYGINQTKQTYTISKLPLKKLSYIRIGEYECEDYDLTLQNSTTTKHNQEYSEIVVPETDNENEQDYTYETKNKYRWAWILGVVGFLFVIIGTAMRYKK